MKPWIISLCLLTVGLSGGCLRKDSDSPKTAAQSRPNMEIRYSDVGDPFLVLQPNDTINFNSRNGGQDVTFIDLAPCEDTAVKRKSCKIGPTKGLYFYECSGCSDPGIAVGSSLAETFRKDNPETAPAKSFQHLTYATPKTPRIVCVGQVGTGYGTPTMTLPNGIQAKKNDVFEVYPVGDFTFSIDMRIGANVLCQELSNAQYNLTNEHPTCTLRDDPPDTGKEFSAVISKCAAQDVTLKFTVKR